jgi:hypothetical protein
VTPQLICLPATTLNCTLRDYEKGTKSEPSQDLHRHIFSRQRPLDLIITSY